MSFTSTIKIGERTSFQNKQRSEGEEEGIDHKAFKIDIKEGLDMRHLEGARWRNAY